MKILVTGGAGFIGSHIVDRYIDEGHDVAVVDDLSTGRREFVNPAATFHELSICDPKLDTVVAQEKPNLINHLAAQMNVTLSVKEPEFDATSNVIGTIKLLESCVKHSVQKIIYAGTGGAVYGEPETLPADEDTVPHPVSHYGVSKHTAEHYIELYSHLYGLCYTILRFPNVYGPRQSPHGEAGVCAILSNLMLDGKQPTLYGAGEPLRDYVYVGDIVEANVAALDKGDGQILNLGSGKGTTVLEIFNILKELLDFHGEPILKPLRQGEVFKIYITGHRAKTVLGWKPKVDMKDGLRRTVDHIKAQQATA